METRKAYRITAFLQRSLSKEVLQALNEAGVQDLSTSAARSLVIKVKKGLSLLLPGRDLMADPLDQILFLAGEDTETALFNLVAAKGHLAIPGMGSVVSEEVTVPSEEVLHNEVSVHPFDACMIPLHPHAVTGICCIVQRGKGEEVGRVALDTGTCVPAIGFGAGTGVRDKMGLLRITIPAEKEIIHVFASMDEVHGLLNMMAEVGHLEQPGKGFIFTYPVKKAVVNMRVVRGGQPHVASIEQVAVAIDHMKGGTEWRQRTRAIEDQADVSKRFLTGLVEINLVCDGETGLGLVKAAMGAGAGGSTIQGLRHVRPPDSPLAAMSPMRELCSFVVPTGMVDRIMDALHGAGAFTDRCHGQVHFRRVPRVLTYLGR